MGSEGPTPPGTGDMHGLSELLQRGLRDLQAEGPEPLWGCGGRLRYLALSIPWG